MALKTYDAKNVIIIYGPLTLSGFAEDSMATLTPEAEIFTSKVGVDGQTTRSRSNNDNYKCTIRFMQSSDSRYQLQEATLRNSALSLITYPFKLVSMNTGEVYESAEAYVEKLPDAEFGREAGEREYTLMLPNCKVSVTESLTSVLGFLG